MLNTETAEAARLRLQSAVSVQHPFMFHYRIELLTD